MYTTKERLRCILALEHWRIEGEVHLLEGSRLTDSMNSKSRDFIAVTDAVVFDIVSGRELFRTPYLAVNRTLVAAVFPVE